MFEFIIIVIICNILFGTDEKDEGNRDVNKYDTLVG